MIAVGDKVRTHIGTVAQLYGNDSCLVEFDDVTEWLSNDNLEVVESTAVYLVMSGNVVHCGDGSGNHVVFHGKDAATDAQDYADYMNGRVAS